MKKSLLLQLFIIHCSYFIGFGQTTSPILLLNTEMHTSSISRVSSDSFGKFILTCSRDKTAKLWSGKTGALILTLRPPIDKGLEGCLDAGALSPDSKIAAVGGTTGLTWDKKSCVYLFSTSDGKLIQRIPGSQGKIWHIKFSPDGKYLAVAYEKSGVHIYSTYNNFKLFKSLTDYQADCTSISFDLSGRMITTSRDNYFRLYSKDFDLLKKKQLESWLTFCSSAFSIDGSKIIAGYFPSSIGVYTPYTYIFDANKFKHVSEVKNEVDAFHEFSFSAEGQYLFGGGSFNIAQADSSSRFVLRRWNTSNYSDYKDIELCKGRIFDINSMADSSIIVGGSFPDLTKVKNTGEILFYKDAEINSYLSPSLKFFQTNNEGNVLSIKPTGKPTFYFSIKNRELTTNQPEGITFNLPTIVSKNVNVLNWRGSRFPTINSNELNISEFVVWDFDISNDEKFVVFGADFGILCFDANGKKIWNTPSAMITSVKITEDRKIVTAATADGTVQWYRMSDGALLLTLFTHPDNKRWIIWTPDGYFDCSQGADNLIGWHVNQGPDQEALFYPASQFYEKFFTPNLGARVLAGEEISGSNLDINNFKLPPLVKITSPENNSTLNSEQLTITVEVTDQGGGIDEILLYQNGKLVQTTSRGFKSAVQKDIKTTKTFTIPLTSGENKIKVKAFNTQRTEAIPAEITLNYSGAKTSSNMYILAVGINAYTNPRYSLNYAVNDANGFVDALKAGASSIFSSISTTIINDAQATRAGILTAIEQIKSKIKPEDVFVFYYAGHGVMSGGSSTDNSDFYLVPADVTRMYEADDMLKAKGISAKEIAEFSKNIKAQKQLFVLDACQSGGAMQSLASRGAAEEKSIAQLARSTGTYFIAASGTEQFATEVKELGHGVFTYSIIEALKGMCKSQDGKITVNLLKSCVEDRVPELTKKYKGESQFPTGYGFGQDFPIVIIK